MSTLEASPCGLFVFGGGGIASSHNIHVTDTHVASNFSSPFDATLTAANLTGSGSVGVGYNVLPWLGVQGDFIYWGNQDYGVHFQFPGIGQSVSSSSRTWSAGIEAVGYLPLCCDTINPFVKVGYARYQSDWRFSSNTGIPIDDFTQFSNKGNALLFGAGLAFAITPCLEVTFQAQAMHTNKQEVILHSVTLCQYSVNLVYHFRSLRL